MSGQPDQAFWEERYRAHPAASHLANPHLVAEASDLAPGRALDAGCGEGADAVWLAERGWRVTAVDFATAALAGARRRAEALGTAVTSRIEWVAADLTTWTPPEESFDLVSAQYVHVPAAAGDALLGRLAAWVAPGGTLLIAGHHPSDRETSSRGSAPELHLTAEQVVARLDPGQWDIVVAEVRPRSATRSDGRAIRIPEAVVRARKRP